MLFKILRREFFQMLRDPRRILFLFGVSIIYLIFFELLYLPNTVKKIPLVIYDAENTKLSREIVTDFLDSDSFKIVSQTNSEESMMNYLHNKEALAAIEIPANFSRQIYLEGSASVLCIIDGTNIITTNVISSSTQEILNAVSEKFAARRLSLMLGVNENSALQKISPVTTNLRVLGNPIQGYLLFFPIGLALAAFQQGLLFAVGASVIHEHAEKREFQTWQLLIGKIIFYWISAFISFAITISAVEISLDLPTRVHISTFLILGGTYAFSIIAFGIFLSSFFNQEVDFIRAVLIYPVPAFIFSGYAFPTEAMTSSMQLISKIFPLTWLANATRDLLLIGHTAHFEKNIFAMLIIGTIFLSLTFLAGKFTKKISCKIASARD